MLNQNKRARCKASSFFVYLQKAWQGTPVGVPLVYIYKTGAGKPTVLIVDLFININRIINFLFNNISKKNDPTWYALLRGVSGSVTIIIYKSKKYVNNE